MCTLWEANKMWVQYTDKMHSAMPHIVSICMTVYTDKQLIKSNQMLLKAGRKHIL